MISQEELQSIAAHLRGASVVTEHITPEYQKNLDLAERREVAVPTAAGTVRCLLFFSKNRTAHCPVHISVHGGGFVRPHRLRDEIWSAKVAGHIGGIVVDVDYSLAPEHPYPAAFNECYDVCRWAFAQAEAWNADPARISMGGYSAGGNLTAAVALKANQTQDFRLCLQVIGYGAMDLATDPADKPEAASNIIPVDRARMFNTAYTHGDLALLKDRYCSPAAAPDECLAGLPRALVLTAGHDNMRFEAETYALRMAAMGVTVTVRRFCRSAHGFIINCGDEWEEAHWLILSAIAEASR